MKTVMCLGLLCMALGLIFSHCASDESADANQKQGLLMDWSKFDGCGWVIELEGQDKSILEPVNLDDFSISLIDSTQVNFRYQISDDQSSACKAGTVVILLEIQEK